MGKVGCLLLMGILLLGVAGCRSVSRPNWLHPGPAAFQQSTAERYDPYPENETGPQIVGARPREFQKPPPESARARWIPWNWGR